MEAVVEHRQPVQHLLVDRFGQIAAKQSAALLLQRIPAQQQIHGKNDGKEHIDHRGDHRGDGGIHRTGGAAKACAHHLDGLLDPVAPVDGSQLLQQVGRQQLDDPLAAQQLFHRRLHAFQQQLDAGDQLGHHQIHHQRNDGDEGEDGSQKADHRAAVFRPRPAAFGEIMPLVHAHENVEHIGDHQAQNQR